MQQRGIPSLQPISANISPNMQLPIENEPLTQYWRLWCFPGGKKGPNGNSSEALFERVDHSSTIPTAFQWQVTKGERLSGGPLLCLRKWLRTMEEIGLGKAWDAENGAVSLSVYDHDFCANPLAEVGCKEGMFTWFWFSKLTFACSYSSVNHDDIALDLTGVKVSCINGSTFGIKMALSQ